MSSKLSQCSVLEIEEILDRNSDSDTEKPINAVNKLQKKSVRIQNTQKNVLNGEATSLKLKLRRSTEQSLYKIQRNSEVKESHHGKQNETEVSRGSRNRRPPVRFSAYHCDTLHAENSSPSLRNRKSINYNEDKLLIKSIVSTMETEQKVTRSKENKKSDAAFDSHNTECKPLNSNVRNKRHHIPSTKDSEDDSDTNIKIIKVKLVTKPSKSEYNLKSILDYSPERKSMTKKSNLLTPVRKTATPSKADKHKRTISNSEQKDIQNTNNVNEEDLSDMYKCITISSTDNTPTTTRKQRKVVSNTVQKNVEFTNKSDIEEEYSTDLHKRKKVSSVKRNILTPQNRNNIEKSIESRLEETHLSTPKSRPIKCSNLTPSMRKRNSVLMKPATPLQEAKSRLHVCAVPKSLPCREEEFNNIFTFLRGKLEDKSGGCIYISGVPGTGKTATVNEAVRCLKKLISKGQLDDFDYVEINGMKLTEPRQAYVQILKQLNGNIVTWEQAYHVLEKRFHRTNSKMTLLLVDELDFLCTKRQDVVYNLLDWPTKATAQLVVITIANTMDLPERVLMGRVTSRLGLTRLTFQPYNYKQLQEIVMSRLKGFNGFRNEAVQLVARKVSAVSGDARRALDICRRAMEIAEARHAENISLQDVTEAVSEMIASAKVQAIKHCSKMEQIFLQAVSAEVTRTSVEEVYFKDAYRQLEALCSFDGIEVPTVTEILAVCARLGASRLLICEHSRNDIYQKILLNVSIDDIHYAIHELNLHSE
nr:PREDICTED: origin recognition complex subunit 1 [Megachile rotundata]